MVSRTYQGSVHHAVPNYNRHLDFISMFEWAEWCTVRPPRGSFVLYPLLSLEVAKPEHQSIRSMLSSKNQESPARKRFFSRVQRTLHATRRTTPQGASRLVRAVSAASSVKTQRAPSRRCRDARVYGHMATTIHDMNRHSR